MRTNFNIAEAPGKAKKRINILVLGIFFLVWSINGFFIGGNTLKLVLLMSGFFLIVFTAFKLPRDIKFTKFVFFTFLILVAYWIIAFLRSQKTTTPSILIFGIICYFLLLSGFLLGRNINRFGKVSNKVILFLSVLTILGVFMYIKFQSVLELNSVQITTRKVVEAGDESGINVIGIAYTNAIIFFILYHFLTFYKLSKWLNAVLFLSILSTFFLIFSTQSRGALIYMGLILLLNNLFKFKLLKNVFKIIFSVILVIFVAAVLFIQAVQYFPVLGNKVEGAIDRFEGLTKLTDDVRADQSAYKRALLIKDFYNNIDDIILFGEEKYKPYPHNQFIEIIMRWGIFFGIPLLYFSIVNFFKSLKILIKRMNINPLINMIALLFVFSFLQSMSSMSLEMNRMLWLGFGFLAGLPALSKMVFIKAKKQTSEYA